MIVDHDIFKNVAGKRKKAPVTHHVLVLLYRLGCQASAASDTSIGTFLGLVMVPSETILTGLKLQLNH
jgi:hypothetical protein